MFSGWERDIGSQVVYVASNAWWEELSVRLPDLPVSAGWTLAVDTWEEGAPSKGQHVSGGFTIRPRSVMVFVGR